MTLIVLLNNILEKNCRQKNEMNSSSSHQSLNKLNFTSNHTSSPPNHTSSPPNHASSPPNHASSPPNHTSSPLNNLTLPKEFMSKLKYSILTYYSLLGRFVYCYSRHYYFIVLKRNVRGIFCLKKNVEIFSGCQLPLGHVSYHKKYWARAVRSA